MTAPLTFFLLVVAAKVCKGIKRLASRIIIVYEIPEEVQAFMFISMAASAAVFLFLIIGSVDDDYSSFY